MTNGEAGVTKGFRNERLAGGFGAVLQLPEHRPRRVEPLHRATLTQKRHGAYRGVLDLALIHPRLSCRLRRRLSRRFLHDLRNALRVPDGIRLRRSFHHHAQHRLRSRRANQHTTTRL